MARVVTNAVLPRYKGMAIVSLLMFLVGLWASVSLVALTLLLAVYVAERAGWRRDEPVSPSERTARTPITA